MHVISCHTLLPLQLLTLLLPPLSDKIKTLVVEKHPTVRTSAITTVNVTVYVEGGRKYTGPLSLSAQYQNGTQLVSGYWPNSNGTQQLKFVLSDSGMSTLSFTASNDIINVVNTSRMFAVGLSQYGAINLVFVASSRLQNTTQWVAKLKNNIIDYVSKLERNGRGDHCNTLLT